MSGIRLLVVVAVAATISIVSACGGPTQGAASAPVVATPGTSAAAPAGGGAAPSTPVTATPPASTPGGATPPPAAETNGALHAERTVAFNIGQAMDLNLMVGPVRLRSVKFVNDPHVSIGERFRTRPGSETETVVRAAFDAENRESTQWQVTFNLSFLDGSGKLIDRVDKKHSWEGESSVYNLDSPILTYVVPLIKNVTIVFDAKVD